MESELMRGEGEGSGFSRHTKVFESGFRDTGSIPAILINFLVFFTAEDAWGGMESE